MPKKPKRVWGGNTPVTPITPKERRKLHKLMKKRLDMRRRTYFEYEARSSITSAIPSTMGFFA